MGAINQVWEKTEQWHEMNTSQGKYRFELWADGWRLFRYGRGGAMQNLKVNMTDDEMVNWIKLLRS